MGALSEKWKKTVEAGLTDAKWDEHDTTMRTAVDGFNTRLADTTDFARLDWTWVKAMVWTESGGPTNPTWKTRAMQIGNPGDPALDVLKKGAEGSAAIVDDALKTSLAEGKINEPGVNIRAGTAYLFTRLAKFAIRSVVDPTDTLVREHTVAQNETAWFITKKEGTTLDELKASNPELRVKIEAGQLKKGQVLKFRKARMQTVVAGWRAIDAATIADRYNGGGDPNYADKLTYVRGLFAKLVRK